MSNYVIGYANSDETIDFAVSVRQGLEKAVAAHAEFELICRDNAADNQRAMANVEEFAQLPVHLAIIYHLDESMGMKLAYPLKMKQIPVISLEHPIPMTTFVGLDDEGLGKMAAEAAGRWAQNNWNGQVDRVVALVDPRRFAGHLRRFAAAISTLQTFTEFSNNQVLYLDSTTHPSEVGERFGALLESWKDFHRIVVMTVSDEMAIPVLETARAVNREEDLAVLSGNGSQQAMEEFQKPFSRLLVSPAVNPEDYGEYLIQVMQKMLKGERVPPANWLAPTLLSREQYERKPE